MPSWSRGRVAVVGDAAYCASPLSGMGTSLALTGSYVLAGELAHHAHHSDAFTRYERILRPYATRAQKLPPGVPRIASPRTRAGIRTLSNTVLRAASRPRRPSPQPIPRTARGHLHAALPYGLQR
ncbi:FAD-dependent monooxygenase [Streptomyces californicus]